MALLLSLAFVGTLAQGATLLSIRSAGDRVLDSKPAGTPHVGLNSGAVWRISNSDGTTTRQGVMQFFAANRNQITIPGTSDFNSADGTIMFWIRTSGAVNANPGEEGAMLFDRRTGSGNVVVLHDNGKLFLQHFPAGIESTAVVDDGNWHHVAITYGQNLPGSIGIYVDGAVDTVNDNAGIWAWPEGQPIELGTSHDLYWRSFNGFLDDVRVYDRRLELGEINQVRTSAAVVDNQALVLRLDFNAVPLVVDWDPTSPTLQWTTNLNGEFVDVPAANSPYLFTPSTEDRFFRTRE